MTPSSLVKGEQTQITLTGSGFAAGDVLASSAGVSFSSLVVQSPTQVTVTATVKATATAMTQDIALRDPTTSSPAVVSRRTITLGAVPHLDGRSANSVFGPNTSNDLARLDGLPADKVPTSVTLGTQGDATFTLASDTPCATTAGKWDCTGAISVPLNAATGRRTITVNYADRTIVQIPNGFQVTPVTVSSMDGFTADGSVHKVEITGTGFWASGTGPAAQPTVIIDNAGTGNTGTGTITVVGTGFADYAHVFAWVQAAPGSQGTYEVAVQNPGLRYGQSQFASVLTVVSTPDAPGSVVATANSDGTATVSWTAPADNGSSITGYTVTPFDVTTSTILSATLTSGTSIGIDGLNPGDGYTFTVTATNGNGESPPSSASTPVTASTIPDAPTSVQARTHTDGKVNVSWTAPADNGSAITSYTVTPYDETTATPSTPTSSTSLSVLVSGLTLGDSYTFTVTATNGNGEGASSSASSAVTPSTVPDSPIAVAATDNGDGTVSVSWTAPADNGSAITSYTVTPYDETTATPSTPTSSTSLSVLVSGLTLGDSYTFTVTATNGNGTGPASSASLPVTTISVPGAPTGIIANDNADGASITVWWTAPANNGSSITGYTVTPYDVTTSTTLSTTGSTGVSVSVGGLTLGDYYTFTVTATNGNGTGPASSASLPTRCFET